MAVLQMYLYSQALFNRVSIRVILPTPSEAYYYAPPEEGPVPGYPQQGQKYQTLWLLHGICHGGESWLYNSDIAALAELNHLAVVIPSCGQSFYQDLPGGGSYFTWLTEELPHALQALFPLSAKRENNFICGFSMGGYGALNLALRRPDLYGKAAFMSSAFGVFHPEEPSVFPPQKYLDGVFGPRGEHYDPDAQDCLRLLEANLRSGKKLPLLYQCCGTEDELIGENRRFHEAALALGADITYNEGPGVHRWSYWNERLPAVLEWLAPARGYVD